MAYVNIPNDLSRIKTKVALNLTKRQLVCFSCAAVVGVPTYLFTRSTIGNTGAMILMIILMLPVFFIAMYERDGLPAEKVARNILNTLFLRQSARPYKTENMYAILTKEEETIVTGKKNETTIPNRKT